MRTENLTFGGHAAGRLLRIVSTISNAAMVIATTFVAFKLWQMASGFIVNAGGLPSAAILDSMMQEITLAMASPAEVAKSHWDTVYARLYWWTLGWITGVFAIGAGLVAIAGLRWGWIKVEEFLSR